jgi:hypothetical protein
MLDVTHRSAEGFFRNARSTDGTRATLRQNCVRPNSSNRFALPRDIGSAPDDQLQAITQLEIVPDSAAFGREGRRKRRRLEARASIFELGPRIAGKFECAARECSKDLNLFNSGKPPMAEAH